jgi:hypothetical protein
MLKLLTYWSTHSGSASLSLDFLIDCIGQRLVPRDPKQIVSEVE